MVERAVLQSAVTGEAAQRVSKKTATLPHDYLSLRRLRCHRLPEKPIHLSLGTRSWTEFPVTSLITDHASPGI